MRTFLFLSLLLIALPASARQLVLVQGYLSASDIWRESGVTRQLERNGWAFQGEFRYHNDGVRLVNRRAQQAPGGTAEKAYYQVALPTEAAIATQAYYLTAYLKKLRQRFPQQSLVVVGHSAGGVVARYAMVRNPSLNIDQLITIASPHLGTDSAELGKLAGDSPLALFTPFFGAGTLNRSQELYADLLPEMPHRFLFWLNRQPHPQAQYISIVRDQQSLLGGDFIVPAKSQYLENVYALRYLARSFIVPGSHGLSARDGLLIVDLVEQRRIPHLS